MQQEWCGVYLDGRVASRQRATVRLLSNGLDITTEQGQTRTWPYAAIRQTQGFYSGEQVRIEHGGPPAEVLLIADVRFLTGLYRLAPHLASRVHDPSRRTNRAALTALAAVATVGIVVAAFRWGIPAFANAAAPWVPVSWEERLGETVVAHLAPAEDRCTDPVLQGRVDAILSAVTARSGSTYTFTVTVVDDDTLNAFAAPGGQIVVLRGLLTRTHTPEELAGVLAHEAQHIIRRHATRAILQHASAGVLVGALTGDVSGVAAFGLDAARNLGLLRYGRDHESEADEAGMRMLLDAGIDPAGMVAFYDVLAREAPSLPKSLQYLSTHPATAERIARIERLAEGAGAPTVSLGSADEWAEVTARCRADSKPAAPR